MLKKSPNICNDCINLKMKDKCAFCNRLIPTNLESFINFGNCCKKCSSIISNKVRFE